MTTTGSSPRPPRSQRLTANPGRGRAVLKQQRAVRTRSQVLDAAAQAFAAKGYPAVTILDVAEITGMTKGAVYFHYSNKEALALAVAEEFYRRLPEIADSVLQMDLSPLESVIELLTQTALAFRDDIMLQAGARLQIERSLIDADLPVPFIGYNHLVASWLKEAKGIGQLASAADPDAIARVLISAFFGAQHISWVLSDRTDLPERVKQIVSVIIPGQHQ
jgi:AcrR family transcriptional regulator